MSKSVLFFTVFLLCSCVNNHLLSKALELAGSNRGELEKVLIHYKDSGEKYKAPGRKKQLCVRCRKVLLEKVIPKTKHKWKLTRKRRTRYDCLKCGGVKLKNEYGGWSYYFP